MKGKIMYIELPLTTDIKQLNKKIKSIKEPKNKLEFISIYRKEIEFTIKEFEINKELNTPFPGNDDPKYIPRSWEEAILILKRVLLYLEKWEKTIPKEPEITTKEPEINEKPYCWNTGFSQNDFLELCYALTESNAIIKKGTCASTGIKEKFINDFAELIGIGKIKNSSKLISKLKNRNYESESKFLNFLVAKIRTHKES
jgi:hypothetical protein